MIMREAANTAMAISWFLPLRARTGAGGHARLAWRGTARSTQQPTPNPCPAGRRSRNCQVHFPVRPQHEPRPAAPTRGRLP